MQPEPEHVRWGPGSCSQMKGPQAGACPLVGGGEPPTVVETQGLGFNVSFCMASKMKTASIGAWAGKVLGSGSDRAGIFLSLRGKVESHQR